MFIDIRILAGLVILCFLLLLTNISFIFFYYESVHKFNQLKNLLDQSNSDVSRLRNDLLSVQDSLVSLKVQSGTLIANSDQALLAVNTANTNQGSNNTLIYLAAFIFIIGGVCAFYHFSGGDGSNGGKRLLEEFSTIAETTDSSNKSVISAIVDNSKRLLEDFFTIAEITDSSNKSVISAIVDNSTVQQQSFADVVDKLTIIHQQMYVLELKLDMISLSYAASTAAVPLSGL